MSSTTTPSRAHRRNHARLMTQTLNTSFNDDELRTLAKTSVNVGKGISSEDEIVETQKILRNHGYDIGEFGEKHDGVDGIAGRMTKAALATIVKPGPTPIAIPDDREQAARGLEFEKRGYKVTYVNRATLPSDYVGRINQGDTFSYDRHTATVVVGNLENVSRIQRDMQERPGDFRQLTAQAKTRVDGDERFDKLATKAMTMPYPAAPR